MRVSRRDVGKGLLAAGLMGGRSAEGQPVRQSGWVVVAPGIWKTSVGTLEAVTPVRTRAVKMAREGLEAMGEVKAPIASPLMTVDGRGARVRIPLEAGEQIYGFGLQFLSLQQRGKKRVTRVNADPKFDTGDSHAPVPFYVTSRGYGVFVDSARYVTFYCGESRRKPEGISDPRATHNLADEDVSEVIAEVPNCQGVEVYLFAGPTMLEAVRRYNLFSGGGCVPPEWGLGFWYRTEGKANAAQVTALAKEFRERKIPCDVLGLEPGWQTHVYSCSFDWNTDLFPRPKSFLAGLKEMGYKVNLWEHAFTHPTSPLFSSLQGLSGDKGVWGGLVPDFGDRRAREVFGDYHGRALIDIGVDGFKMDECDNSDYTGGWSFAELSRFPSGADGEQMHSLFGLRYQQTLWEEFKKRDQPTYQLVRSSGALAAPYPSALYSDLYNHRDFVRALVNSGFSGLLWCPEVRDAASEEDLIRRMETAAFSPLMMVNGWYIKNPPWKQLDKDKNNADELMPGWESLEARCREIIGWRMKLVPYLRAAFEKYATDGTPPFRALALDWPDDPVAKVDDAWMVGEGMLVAPLFAGEPGRTVTLPPGSWFDYWSGKPVAGTLEIGADARIPVFLKAGSNLRGQEWI